MVRKNKKVEQEHDFFYPEGKVHLYEADEFLSQVKHMMSDAVRNKDFAVYFGINEKNCIDVWIRDDEGIMYQIEPRNLDNEESEIRLNEIDSDEAEYKDEEDI